MNTKILILIACILLSTLASLIVGSLAKIPDEHFKHRHKKHHHKHHKKHHHKHHINTASVSTPQIMHTASVRTPQIMHTASVSTPQIIQSTNATSLPSNISTSINTPQYVTSASVNTPQIIQPTNATSSPSNISIPSNLVSSGYSPVPQKSDPYVKIYKDKAEEGQLASQPIKYMSDTLDNCKLACDNNTNCVGISRSSSDYNPDILGDCTLLTYPYNLSDENSGLGWITYAKQ